MDDAAPLRAAVAGATGYIGWQCVALIGRHPRLMLAQAAARTSAGRRLGDVVPGAPGDIELCEQIDPSSVDVIFSALPHTLAAAHAAGWLAAGAAVVDLSADFRLRDVAEWERTYAVTHPAPALCRRAVYALPELAGEDLLGADLLAAPGCYPTASLLACAPALRAGLVEADVVIDAKSGVSGAGRSPGLGSHFAEVNEAVRAYGVTGHRHKPEIVQELTRAAGAAVHCTFVPHLVPMTRGILATAYLRPRNGTTPADIDACYREFAAAHPCVVLSDASPSSKVVSGTGLAALHAGWQDGVVVVTAVIDNLLKGAASQAVQAFNLSRAWPEALGLPLQPAWP